MLQFEPMHAPQDDLPPIDYAYAPSVTEGVRRERAQKMHPAPAEQGLAPARPLMTPPRPIMPQSVDEYGIPDDPFHPSEESQRPARRSRAERNRAAEPQPMTEPQPVPEPAAEPQPVTEPQPVAEPRVGKGARIAMPVMTAADGSQFEAPQRPDVPDWLRVAQQNNLPLNRPQQPRVQAAPRREDVLEPEPVDVLGRPLRNRRNVAAANAPQAASDVYASAGYPKHLLDAQRQLEAQAAATPIRRRHGAQYAAPQQASPVSFVPQPQPVPAPVSPYQRPVPSSSPWDEPIQQPVQPSEEAYMSRAYHRPRREEPSQDSPYQIEEDEPEERTLPRLRIPWLGIAVFVAVLAAIILWIMQMNYANQTQAILDERAANEQAILEAHPIRYTEVISNKANKYNLHPAFVAAIMLNESSFRADATSSVDARGLMQLMDDTASWIYGKMDSPAQPYDFDMMYDPETNAEYGCWYLNYLSELFYGDPILVAAAYHAGQGEVRNWLNNSQYSKDGRSIALEDMIDGNTKVYVTRVLKAFAAYKRLYFGG